MAKGREYGELTLSFQAKVPYNTWFIVIEYPENKPPLDILSRFEAVGWTKDAWVAPPMGGIATSTISKKGRGVFGSWTPRQQVIFMNQATLILDELGYENVPKIKLQFRDQI